MFARLFSATLQGVDAIQVEIEVNVGLGDPKVIIVGLPDAAVRESRDRVAAALQNSGFKRPNGRTTINLAPANLRKEGPGFDLSIALGLIALTENLDPQIFSQTCIIGELALDGSIRKVRGALATALEARRQGHSRILVPRANTIEASAASGIEVYGIDNLRQAREFLTGDEPLTPEPNRARELFAAHADYGIDFTDVKGQQHVKRAITVAVAGNHNLLMIGPPGTGKSMIAKRIATIMPPLSEDEAIDTTKIHSAGGLLDSETSFVSTRPFRSPHHTISDVGLLGGGSHPGPGEVSLAHNGLLFLDELPEFRRNTLEVLRQPLEDHQVSISRAAGKMTFPANFMLISAMNPCPCGYYGDPKRDCRCSPNQIDKYRQRISGPLLDRIDLHVEVPLVDFKELSASTQGETSDTIRQKVIAARTIQQNRFKNQTGVHCNSTMTPKLMQHHCALDTEASQLLELGMGQLNFSARAHDRILKVARTIADLAESSHITSDHISEAIQYRSLDRSLWS